MKSLKLILCILCSIILFSCKERTTITQNDLEESLKINKKLLEGKLSLDSISFSNQNSEITLAANSKFQRTNGIRYASPYPFALANMNGELLPKREILLSKTDSFLVIEKYTPYVVKAIKIVVSINGSEINIEEYKSADNNYVY